MSKARAPMDGTEALGGDLGPLFARARSADPETSKAAAREVTRTGAAAKQAKAIRVIMQDLAAVCRNPATASELADLTPALDRYQVARRLPEMREAGWVANGPARKCRVTGRSAMTWRLV